jgi:hypothetical protein
MLDRILREPCEPWLSEAAAAAHKKQPGETKLTRPENSS